MNLNELIVAALHMNKVGSVSVRPDPLDYRKAVILIDDDGVNPAVVEDYEFKLIDGNPVVILKLR